MLVEYLFGIEDGGLLLNIILHIATLLAVVVIYRKRLRELFTPRLIAATAITCAFVVVFKDIIDNVFIFNLLPFAFITTAVVLLLPAVIKPKANNKKWLHAIVMGVAQGVAVIPGFSRSGFTITAGQLAGQDKTSAADFSFLMSVPIIVASLLYEIVSGGTIVDIGLGNVIIAFVAAFVSGLLSIKFMLSLIRKIDLRWFSLYLFVLGIILFFHIF
jgi:undecaprenyl-diphosphatase